MPDNELMIRILDYAREHYGVEQEVAGIERPQLRKKQLGAFAQDCHHDAGHVIHRLVKQQVHKHRKRGEPQGIDKVVVDKLPEWNSREARHEFLMRMGEKMDDCFP